LHEAPHDPKPRAPDHVIDNEIVDNEAVKQPTLIIGSDRIVATVAPADGGRLARVAVDGVDLLVTRGSQPDTSSALAWGSYPMVPWAGRIRDGFFSFRGRRHELPLTLGPHAIHGVGFVSAWDVERADDRSAELRLPLPRDARWPFGGTARQRVAVDDTGVRLELAVTADDVAFPASIGWHPWFRKPDRLDFRPTAMFRRDRHHVTLDELVAIPPGPWDDCFVNEHPVDVEIDGVTLRLTSDCTTWVVFDEKPHATCIEPQTAPPDAFNIRPHPLEPGDSLAAWYRIDVLG
jgi:aldose 1-epimerase